MGFPFFRRFDRRKTPKVEPTVSLSCDELVRDWGVGAYDRATFLSWEQDFGFNRTQRPGHWWRVRQEIDRRNGRVTREPEIDTAA